MDKSSFLHATGQSNLRKIYYVEYPFLIDKLYCINAVWIFLAPILGSWSTLAPKNVKYCKEIIFSRQDPDLRGKEFLSRYFFENCGFRNSKFFKDFFQDQSMLTIKQDLIFVLGSNPSVKRYWFCVIIQRKIARKLSFWEDITFLTRYYFFSTHYVNTYDKIV